MAFPLKEKENNSHTEALVRLHCPFQSCEKFYKNKKSLLEHFRLYPAHKPEYLLETSSRKRISTKDIVERFLNGENPYSRRQRVRELILQLTDEEIVEFTLPRIVDVVPPADVFLEGSSCSGDVFQKLVTFREQICLRFPELKTFFYPSPSPSTSYQDPKQKFIDMVLENKSDCCEWLLEIGDGSLVKDSLMPLVFKREHSAFKEFSCGIVGSFGISQRETQDILRNKWGKTIEQVIGINPILSKGDIFNQLNDTRHELLEKIGLTFNEFGEVVVGFIDIEKYITLFLSQSGVQSYNTKQQHDRNGLH